MLFIIINIVMDFFLSEVDLVGHIGGLFGGFFIVFIVGAPMLGTVDYLKRLLSGAVLTVSLVILTLELK